MKRTAFSSLLLTASLAWPSAVGAAESYSESSAPPCQQPVPARGYEGQVMTYGLEIDLIGCDWWDGGPIRLAASLSRLDGTGEYGTTSIALCGARIIADDGTDEPPARPAPTCAITAALEHPPAKIAFYKGEVTYPWRDGDVTVKFQALCGGIGTAAKCQDL